MVGSKSFETVAMNTSGNYIAIDPGVGGGIAWQISEEIGVGPMPANEPDIVHTLRNLIARGAGTVAVVIEDIPKFTGVKLPGSVMAVLHGNAGLTRGATLALCARMIMVKPHDWQKYFKLGTKGDCSGTTEWKNKLKGEAQRRFPHMHITLKTADAILIMEWARLTGQ